MAGHTTLAEASWYRFGGAAGTHMPEWAPTDRACGTWFAGWLSRGGGEFLSPGLPASVAAVCFAGPWSLSSSYFSACRFQMEAQACACSYDGGLTTTYLYKLPQPVDTRFMGSDGDMPDAAAFCGTHASQPRPPPHPPHPQPPPPSPPSWPAARAPLPPPPPPPLAPHAFCHATCPQTLSGSTAGLQWPQTCFRQRPICPRALSMDFKPLLPSPERRPSILEADRGLRS